MLKVKLHVSNLLKKVVKALFIRSHGYTLIEVTIVLFIITLVGSVTVSSFVSMSDEKVAKDFLKIVESDLLFAQQYALSHGGKVELLIDTEGRKYLFRHHFSPIMTRHYDEGILFERGTLHFQEVAFLANGNVQKGGTILVTINEQLYRIVFLLGRGRFYIERV